MWTLIIRTADGKPQEHQLTPGKTTLGRQSNNDITVVDVSASRKHAEITFDKKKNTVKVTDLKSTNGTFVNRRRISGACDINNNDSIRIGGYVITIKYKDSQEKVPQRRKMDSRPLTRELILESLDQHAVLMYDVARELNTVVDIDTALSKVASLMERAMGADVCKVILADQFFQLQELGFPTTIARKAIKEQSAVIVPNMNAQPEQFGKSAFLMQVQSALCVPVMAGNEVIGLIYLYKTQSDRVRPFDKNDVELAVAISHQTALTIQRMYLLDRVREQNKVRQLLQRFLSPAEAELLVENYLATGKLPELAENTLSILFIDIVNSTGMAEEMSPQKFGDILGHYYQDMTDIVFKYDGIVNKYMGDGVMAVFGMIGDESNHEINATRAGLAMLRHIEKDFQQHRENFQVGVGVNTGTVLAGYLGTKQRVELTIVGDTVNVAFRLQDMAKPNRLLVAPGTVAGISGQYQTQRVGAVTVKGRLTPVQVYEVLRG